MCLFDCVPFVLFRYQNICFTPNNSDLTELKIPFIDVSRILKSIRIGTGSGSYTPMEDCVLAGYVATKSSAQLSITIDGVYIAQFFSANSSETRYPYYVPIKKGQVVAYTFGSGTTSTIMMCQLDFYALK